MTRTTAAPAKPPKWRRRPEHRPQQIIEAALEVFGECGLAKSRLQDIADRAGVSKGTIYLYFPNKEELFREMVRQTAVAAIENAEKTITHGTPTEQLCAAMRGYWNFVRSPVFSTIYRLVRSNQIPAFHIGSDWRFNIEAIDRWCLEQQNFNARRNPRQ